MLNEDVVYLRKKYNRVAFKMQANSLGCRAFVQRTTGLPAVEEEEGRLPSGFFRFLVEVPLSLETVVM